MQTCITCNGSMGEEARWSHCCRACNDAAYAEMDAEREAQPRNEQTWTDRAIGPRVVGGTYHNGYWSDTYTVEEIKVPDDRSGWAMRVRWSDGRATIHSTAWDAERDSVVTTPTVPERAPEGTTKTQRLEAIVQGILCNSKDAPCTCHCHLETARCYKCAVSMRFGNAIAGPPVPERAPDGMLAVRVGSDPWTMIPLDNE